MSADGGTAVAGRGGPIRRLRAVAERAGPGPLAIRAGAFVTAAAALFTAAPSELLGTRLSGLLVLLAAVPALAPRGVGTTAAALAAVACWLLSTSLYGDPIELWRLFGLAAFLYLTHSLAALAAVLPYDTAVGADVLVRWLSRAFGVLAAAAVPALFALSVAGLAGGRVLLAVTLAGLALAVGVAALLSTLLGRRP